MWDIPHVIQPGRDEVHHKNSDSDLLCYRILLAALLLHLLSLPPHTVLTTINKRERERENAARLTFLPDNIVSRVWNHARVISLCVCVSFSFMPLSAL